MDLSQEILAQLLSNPKVEITFPQLAEGMTVRELAEMKCLHLLCDIVALVREDIDDDVACFKKMERLIDRLEQEGICTLPRHDFG